MKKNIPFLHNIKILKSKDIECIYIKQNNFKNKKIKS